MTIKLVIKNEDSRENAIVAVNVLTNKTNHTEQHFQLKGGESKEVYIHEGINVRIHEVHNG